MRLNLSRLHFPVTTLGPGQRIGVWLQGCSLRCPGCVSVDTWPIGRGETTVEAVIQAMIPWLPEATGFTISGGEPLQQPDGLEELLRSLRALPGKKRDILVYSGYEWEAIANRIASWNGLADVLISEPFRAEAGQTLAWRGSDNQRMHLLTDLGRERFSEWVIGKRSSLPLALDVFFQDGEVWMAGIPEIGALDSLQIRLEAAGFSSRTSQARTGGTPQILA